MIDKRNPADADVKIIDAYKHVFKETGKDGQIDIVLDDLADFSGYFATTPEDATGLYMARCEGRREVFARILYLVGVSSEYREALRKAATAIHEALNDEGSR